MHICMFVSSVHPEAVLNATFCLTCRLSILVENARGDHMVEAYSRAMSVLFLYTTSCYGRVHLLLVEACVSVLICCECVCCM